MVGMAQRVAVARRLVTKAAFLLPDEPLGPALTRLRLQDELSKNSTMIVTHDLEEAIYLGDRHVIMHPLPGESP
ncbi:hypothetical protein NKH36_31160 [Mesorhizobium sp. M1312]|uniref:hypothetical protein n=1 Tax=unclassified Mesorhizobium TaxID=325217 RepID=UPI00333D81B8